MKVCIQCGKSYEEKGIGENRYSRACHNRWLNSNRNYSQHKIYKNEEKYNKNPKYCLKKYGWYSPTNKNNNLNGVSWDHLFPVWKGYEMNIPSDIMSHPANAQLVPHKENMRRYSKREIKLTYEELLERIKQWPNCELLLYNDGGM